MVSQEHETAKHVLDAASISIWAAALIDLLPAVAAIVSIIWGLIRIYETDTVQNLLGKRHRRKEDPPDEGLKEEE